MTRRAAAVLLLLTAIGCGYWRARPGGDTAPATWGDGGSATAPSPVAPASPAAIGGVEERLQNLERLRRDGLIGRSEYRERRQQVLQDSFD